MGRGTGKVLRPFARAKRRPGTIRQPLRRRHVGTQVGTHSGIVCITSTSLTPRMIRVQVRPNEPLEAALRRFKRQCNYAGIFRLAKKHAYHEKSSDKRRREGRERLRNILMAERKRGGGGSSPRSNKKRRSRPGQGNERRDNQPDFDPLTADTTLDRKAATEAGNIAPGTENAESTTPAAPATPAAGS